MDTLVIDRSPSDCSVSKIGNPNTAPIQFTNNRIVGLIGAVLIALLTVEAAAQENDSGRTRRGDVGDALQIALPLAALSTSVIKKDWQGTGEFAKGFAASLGTTYLLKETISKERPDGRDDDSFPSSHTAVSFHAAAYIHERYSLKWALPVYVAAAYVGYSRVVDDRHDEQDVLVGAAIGYVAARYFTTEYQGVTITPALSENLYGVHLSYRF